MNKLVDNWEIIRDEGLRQIDVAPLIDLVRSPAIDMGLFADTYGWVKGWTGSPKWLNYGLIYNSELLLENGKRCPLTFALIQEFSKGRKIVMIGYSLLKT